MKIHVITLGCPKNIVDSEYLMGGLAHQNVKFVNEPQQAEIIIINTCSFLLSAREEAIQTILEAIRLKDEGLLKKIYVTGCLPQKYKQELVGELPEVDAFYEQLNFRIIADKIAKDLRLDGRNPKIREQGKPGNFAYLKIAEGCNNRCSYCLIPSIKGDYVSRDPDAIIDEATFLAEQGVKELIIVAQDTTYYGKELAQTHKLTHLLENISGIGGLKWIRLLYAHPAHLDDSLIDLMASNEKICSYIDLPIQHISDKVLKKMGRKVNSKQIRQLIEKLRARINSLAVRSTVIVGFPGETDADFMELHNFIEEIQFERLGVFKYSKEEETKAARLPNQISEREKEDRHQAIMETQREISWRLNSQLVGKNLEIVIDGFDEEINSYTGRTQWDSPDIDNLVIVKDNVRIGNFYEAKIMEAYEFDLVASAIKTHKT